MAKQLEVYKCQACGVMFELLNDCTCEGCAITCCGKPATLLTANTVDAAKEKHVPVIEKAGATVKVTVGSVPHPMLAEHYIEWIELLAGGKAYRQFLKPGEDPVAVFPAPAGEVTVREHCNLHGLWEA